MLANNKEMRLQLNKLKKVDPGNAHVYGRAMATDSATVYGNSHVCGTAVVSGYRRVYNQWVGCDGSPSDAAPLPEENVISRDLN